MLTLSEFDPSYIAREDVHTWKIFAWSFINDRAYIVEKQKLFYTESEKSSEEVLRVVHEPYMRKYVMPDTRKIRFEATHGVIHEMFHRRPFTLELPFFEWGKDITDDYVKHILPTLAKEGMIDDMTYILIRSISNLLRIYYDTKTKKIWFWKTKWIINITPTWTRWRVTAAFKASEVTLEDVLDAEVNQWFVNKDIWDPDKWYAYTHLLRAHAQFRLFKWARKILLNWRKYNVVATSRWQWKSYLAAFIVARELFSQKPGYWWRKYRNIKYFVPDKTNIGEEVMRYIESLLGDLIHKKLPNGEKVIQIDRKSYIIKCNLTGNIFQLISLHGYGKNGWELWSAQGEGISADVAIIDEAARIPDEFWASFHQRAAFETDTFFFISTINEETPKDHWFYKILVDGESGDDRIYSIRVTIDENELMRWSLSDEEFLKVLEDVKDSLRKKWDKEFYAKGYCIILDESNIFDPSQNIISSDFEKYKDTDFRVLWFDLWKLQDTCWLVLINLTHMEIEEARIVQNAKYGTQLEYAEDYKKRFKNVLIIGDRTWVGEAVSEQDVHWVVDTWIKSTGQWELTYNKTHGFYTCSKGKIITTTATVLWQRMFMIPNHLIDLIEQMRNFIKLKSGNGSVILYKGKGKKKDDLVLSMAYAIIYIYLILWLKSKEDVQNFIKESWFSEIVSYNDNDDAPSSYYQWLY